jgi:uncharacterized oxidoreductase
VTRVEENRREVRIPAEAMETLVRETFIAAGCPREESARIGTYLVRANLTGHDSHGVIRVPRYYQWMRAGRVHPGREMTVITENDVMALVDGNFGFGQTIGPRAVQLGIDKAAGAGVSIIALRRSGHLGRIGDWAEMAAAAGLVAIHLVNVSGSILVAPFGAAERRMATNPLAIGIPLPDEPPMILDFATSVVAEGKVLVALKGGKPLPEGSLIDEAGSFSTDPLVFYGSEADSVVPNPGAGRGAIRAMGEHKGSGLSLMIELLAGALTGSGCAGPGERPLANGMLSIYMAPGFFDSDDYFAGEVRQYVDYFKSARPAEPGGEVLVPGEPERRKTAARLAEGLPLAEEAWQEILATAREAGVSRQEIDGILEGSS